MQPAQHAFPSSCAVVFLTQTTWRQRLRTCFKLRRGRIVLYVNAGVAAAMFVFAAEVLSSFASGAIVALMMFAMLTLLYVGMVVTNSSMSLRWALKNKALVIEPDSVWKIGNDDRATQLPATWIRRANEDHWWVYLDIDEGPFGQIAIDKHRLGEALTVRLQQSLARQGKLDAPSGAFAGTARRQTTWRR